VSYVSSTEDVASLTHAIELDKTDFTAVLSIPKIDLTHPQGIILHTKRVAGFRLRMTVQAELARHLTAIRLAGKGLDETAVAAAQKMPSVGTEMIGSAEGSSDNKIVAFACAFAIGMIMYIALIIYGVMVMHGVVEEKSNRIVELIVSAVRPFHMMLGKIIGVAAVGLTQFVIWIIMGVVLFQIALPWLGPSAAVPQSLAHSSLKADDMEMLSTFLANIASIDFNMLIFGFIIYFVGGYFFYASLFAAAASAANDASDLNSLSFPITFPLIISFFVLNVAMQDPHGSVAFWFSMVPFTSPVVMIGRIPFGVPWWEIGLSIVFLFAGFVATAWVASRIYRIGILLYGKKHSFAELIRWTRYS